MYNCTLTAYRYLRQCLRCNRPIRCISLQMKLTFAASHLYLCVLVWTLEFSDFNVRCSPVLCIQPKWIIQWRVIYADDVFNASDAFGAAFRPKSVLCFCRIISIRIQIKSRLSGNVLRVHIFDLDAELPSNFSRRSEVPERKSKDYRDEQLMKHSLPGNSWPLQTSGKWYFRMGRPKEHIICVQAQRMTWPVQQEFLPETLFDTSELFGKNWNLNLKWITGCFIWIQSFCPVSISVWFFMEDVAFTIPRCTYFWLRSLCVDVCNMSNSGTLLPPPNFASIFRPSQRGNVHLPCSLRWQNTLHLSQSTLLFALDASE